MVVVTLPGGGGVGTPDPALAGLAPGTVCTVVEDTSGVPPGTVVTYDPPGADTTGVTLPDLGTGDGLSQAPICRSAREECGSRDA